MRDRFLPYIGGGAADSPWEIQMKLAEHLRLLAKHLYEDPSAQKSAMWKAYAFLCTMGAGHVRSDVVVRGVAQEFGVWVCTVTNLQTLKAFCDTLLPMKDQF